MASPGERLTAKLEQLPISDDAPMCSLLRTTLLAHAQQGSDITEPTVLGLLAITGVLEERLTRLEAMIQPVSTTT
ncbi:MULTISPECIES: hypothetical protein [Rhodococcus]|jgi:hypothetical protein|uniref:Uncharacterized protein n=1 Tax=Rhodococcus qingshengii TaxID=334542 RepID=A0A1C4GR35_RHOSG|nr:MULTISPECIES: hypothetical protein [Rhodococcus]EEN86258.1 hypothetical protein RHOER0001_6234 [Rhodococcus erythropolis SK121]ANQ75801.1 hypothetical protein AOT96_33005 [Rhodococcus sp. 008]KSU57092.1 hypothetical protein AS032_35025 [Rhodococcus qingshengii]MBX9152221.1 hypothetical protein [Rhodococcus qingshengii]MBY6389141.1 hypothetical protein [Rhodococcus erythropolis]